MFYVCISEKRVSTATKQLTMMEMLKLKFEGESSFKRREQDLEERRIALQERKMKLEEDRLKMENQRFLQRYQLQPLPVPQPQQYGANVTRGEGVDGEPAEFRSLEPWQM